MRTIKIYSIQFYSIALLTVSTISNPSAADMRKKVKSKWQCQTAWITRIKSKDKTKKSYKQPLQQFWTICQAVYTQTQLEPVYPLSNFELWPTCCLCLWPEVTELKEISKHIGTSIGSCLTLCIRKSLLYWMHSECKVLAQRAMLFCGFWLWSM